MKVSYLAIVLPLTLGLTACGTSQSYQTAISGVVVSSRIVQRAPLPRAVSAKTVAVHHHAQKVDVAYPYWDAADPYQPWKSNYAPNLGEAGNNDGSGTTGGDSTGGGHSSNGTY